ADLELVAQVRVRPPQRDLKSDHRPDCRTGRRTTASRSSRGRAFSMHFLDLLSQDVGTPSGNVGIDTTTTRSQRRSERSTPSGAFQWQRAGGRRRSQRRGSGGGVGGGG